MFRPNEHVVVLKNIELFDTGTLVLGVDNNLFPLVAMPKNASVVCGKFKGHTKKHDPLLPISLRFSADIWSVKGIKGWLEENSMDDLAVDAADKTRASKDSFVIKCASGDFELVLANDSKGVPSEMYKKELIRTGDFVKESDGIDFAITADTLSHWVDTFNRMKENGVEVPVPISHYESDADGNRGYVRDMFVEGDGLFATIELIGEDGILAAKRNDVSIYCPVEWVDGAGNVYYRPIVHVALTPYPIIPGLKEFESLAASLLVKSETKQMDFTKLKAGLNIGTEVTDDNAVELVLSAVAKFKETHTKELEEIKKVNDQALKLSGEVKTPDPVLVKLACENRDMKLSALVSAGKVTPKVKLELQKLFSDHETLSLSLGRGIDDHFDALVEILTVNDPVSLKEKSGAQDLSLSGATRSEKQTSLVADAQARAKKA